MSREQRDSQNNAKLLRELAGFSDDQRAARFVCVMALAVAEFTGGEGPRIVATSRGTFEGRIGREPSVPRGTFGFGYDPLLLVGPDFERTGAELLPAEKNARSHRGLAARQMGVQICALGLASSEMSS
jgi:non-canonical purine NTP pyrophosphatase (RdgB/HAM1 family)